MLISKIFKTVAISTVMLSIALVSFAFVAPVNSEAKYVKPKKYKDNCKWVTIKKRKVCIQ